MLRFKAIPCFFATLVCCCFSIHAQATARVDQSLPLVFEANQGQVSPKYSYHFHHDGMDTLFTRRGMDIVLRGKGDHPLHVEFAGSHAAPQGKRPLSGHTNYLLGSDSSNWISNVPLFSEIQYADLYPGVSLNFYGNGSELEHDFVVAPGADPSQIAFRIEGASGFETQPDGNLAIHSVTETLVFH